MRSASKRSTIGSKKDKARSEKSPQNRSEPFQGRKETIITPTPSVLRTSNIKCLNCLGKSHITSQCPNRRAMIVRDDGEVGSDNSHGETSTFGEFESNIAFTLERYEDKVLSDVVPMEATHLLLGKPWQFDRKVNHDGVTNRYERFAKIKDVFPKDIPLVFPPLRGIEHHIDLSLREMLPNKTTYRMNPNEGKRIQKKVGKLLDKGWIRKSISPCAMHVILVPKNDCTLRICTDCRPINNITIRYRHPIPQLDDLMNCVGKGGEGHEWEIAFKKNFGLYEWLVMPFDFTNEPRTFMRSMNHILRSLIGKCVVVYFDNMLIYSTCLNDHLLHVRSVLEILRKETLFDNLEKCIFCTNEVIFLGFVVSSHRVNVNREKVKAIQDWPTSKTVGEVRSFHGLASFYRIFVKDFSTLATLLNEIERLTQALILALPNFSKSFKLECDAYSVWIEVVFLKEGHQIVHLNYSTYDQKLFALEFVIQSDHEYLKNLREQGKLNVVVDVLSRRHTLIAMLETKMIGLDCIRELYEKDIDFSEPFVMCVHVAFHDYYRHDGFLFKGKRLCVPMSSIQQLVVKETHEGGFMGRFRELQTFDVLNVHLFWPHIRKDVHNICEKCLNCKVAKSKVSPHEVYTPLLIPTTPWVDISMNFVLVMPRSKRGRDSIFVVVDKFSKMVHFIYFHKSDDASHMAYLFFIEVVRIHGLPRTIVLDKDFKFIGHFWSSISPSPVQIPHSSSQSISALGSLMTIAKYSSIAIPRIYAIATSSVDRD
ncbi:hypothetical protein CR513_24540, partial [Mucuna pruriens]